MATDVNIEGSGNPMALTQPRHLRSAQAQACRGWYNLSIWRGKGGLRQQLSRQPLCERCKKAGRITAATIVNYRQPHKGGWSLFVDPDNQESLSALHHDTVAQKDEARG